MSRMEINALMKVVDSAETGRYTLPAEVTDALTTYRRTREVELPEAQTFNADMFAGRILSALAAGEDPNLTTLVQSAGELARDAEAVRQVHVALTMAIELAESAATTVASDMVEKIISKHLAPAYRELLAEVREVASALQGYSTDAHTLLTAPTKVRNAYLKLPELVVRNQTIREARKLMNVMGHRKAQHDASDLFALLAKPMALRPGWKPPARIDRLDMPTDPTEFLLWLVSDAVAPGEPWLPTIAEQDAAWWKQFGEAQEMRSQAHRNGVAVGARA